MIKKNVNFDDEKIKKSDFYKNKKKQMTLMLIIY